MPAYLLDTNHLGYALNPVSHLRERIHQAQRSGIRIGTCVPVLCEAAATFPPRRHVESVTKGMRRLLGRVRLWPLDPEIATLYGEIFRDLRGRGKILSQVDMILAALARLNDLTLLTSDKDFEALPDIHTDNWLV